MRNKNIHLLALVFLFLSFSVKASLPTVPVIYGTPYDINSAYNHRVHGAPSVDAAIALWWERYKVYWGKTDAQCFYTVRTYSNVNPGGALASITLGGECGGGDGVFGTIKCPSGYALSNNTCILQGGEQLDKEKGLSCNNAGGPINSANGNKNKVQDDFAGPGPFPVRVSRTYNSNDDTSVDSGLFGHNWSWNHGGALVRTTLQGKEFITIKTEVGGAIRAIYEGGQWETDEDVHVNIVKTENGYVITYPNNKKEIYALDGRLLSSELNADYKFTYVYNGAGLLSQICNPGNYCLSLVYNSKGMVSGFKNGSSAVLSYEYDSLNRLTKVTDEFEKSREYLYEDSRFPFALTGISDERGVRYSTYTYDEQGRGVSTELSGGVEKYSFAYNSDGTTTITNPLGKNTTYTYQLINGVRKVVSVQGHPSTNCASGNRSYTYDSDGNLKTVVDWKGNVTTYTHNDRGLETSRTEATGTPQARTTTTTWHATFNLPLTVTEGGQVTTYTYDAQGRQTSRTQTAQ